MVPWEEATDEAYERKRLRYSNLAAQAEERGWTVLVCPVELGCRGFVANSTIRLLKEVGIRGQAQRRTIKELATTAERNSHWLWLQRKEMAGGGKVTSQILCDTHPVTDAKEQLTTWERPGDCMESLLTGGNRPQWGWHGLAPHAGRIQHHAVAWIHP
ncbi:hypothetical protein SRHO_G00291340 [Serrasalmus rhombeus]